MEELRFTPVCLKDEGKRTRLVISVEQAIHVLEHHWPADDPTRPSAVGVCKLVLKGRAAPSAARDALMRAARRVGIYIPLDIIDCSMGRQKGQ